jgi:hypothetical protein
MPKKRACRRDSTQGESYDCPLLHTHSSPKALKSGLPIEVNAKGEAWSWVELNFGKGRWPMDTGHHEINDDCKQFPHEIGPHES